DNQILITTSQRSSINSAKQDVANMVQSVFRLANASGGNCTTFCPTNSAPYKEKPHIYLTRTDYDAAVEGYYLERSDNAQKLLYKNEGIHCTLIDMGDLFRFENENMAVDFDKSNFAVKHTNIKSNTSGAYSLEQAATMAVVLKGAQQLVFE
ncbi:MAG: hypothetical protein R6U85_04760, partial [Salinivirgaceae bacterium]